MKRLFGWTMASLILAVPVLMIASWAHPPELIRVAAGYTAKIVCSNVFLAGRDPLEVLATDVQALESDMAAFAGAKPLEHPVGRVWSYSSGSAVILARIFQDTAGPDAIGFVQSRLFDPLGMNSAVMETDEKGTLVGSSYMYATPRDWARYGQLLAQDGVWEGREILPRGYVSMMGSPAAASGGEYGRGMVWRWVTHSDGPGENPDVAFGIPADAFWMAGHDGQYVVVIPSLQLVVVRMGLTPEREHYRPEPLVRSLLEAAAGRSPLL